MGIPEKQIRDSGCSTPIALSSRANASNIATENWEGPMILLPGLVRTQHPRTRILGADHQIQPMTVMVLAHRQLGECHPG